MRLWLQASGGRAVHIVGVGNSIRQDDAAGLEVVSMLKRSGPGKMQNVKIHPNSLNPERVMSRVASRGEKLLLFDAVEANEAPGSVLFAGLEDTKYGFFATHNVPLRLVPGLSEHLGDAKVIGIQPEILGVGEGLSETVRSSCARVASTTAAILREMADGHD